MKTNRKHILSLILLLSALIAALISVQSGFAANTDLVLAPTPTPKSGIYQVVINPPDNDRSLLFKGKLEGVEIKGWWLDVSIDGQKLEIFLKTHPTYKFVITTNNEKKTGYSAAQYLQGGLRFSYGKILVSLLDGNDALVFGNLNIQTGGQTGVGGGSGSGTAGSGSSGSPPDSGGSA